MLKSIKTITAAAVLGMALLSSCQKELISTVPVSTDPREITLRTTGAMTKSAVNGTAFPQGYDMVVSAYRNLGATPGEDTAQDYFEGIRFGYDGGASAWKSEMGAKYYPLDGTLDFLAIAGAGLNDAATGIVPTFVWGESSNVAKKVVATVPANHLKFDDILYGAANAQGLSASGSAISFKHAMTSVVFLAKCNVAYNAVRNEGITLDGITIDGAKHSGTLTVSNPSAGSGSGDLSAEWSSLGSAQTHVAARVWNAANLGTNVSEAALANLNLGTSSKELASYPFGEGYVILPPQAAVPFTVTYTIHNGLDADGETPLNKQVQTQITPSGNWDMGKKNVYEIEFNLTEITIHPSVVDWDVVENETIPVPDLVALAANGHDYVDLGLRVGGNKILFAKCNIGAASEEEYGDYFQWGDTVVRYSDIDDYDSSSGDYDFSRANCIFHTGADSNTGWSKYIPSAKTSYWGGPGDPDNKLTLDASDDVASVLWGGSWRMPDTYELNWLINRDNDGDELNPAIVNYEWTNDYNSTGIAGIIVTGTGNFSGTSLFLPATGHLYGAERNDPGICGTYWTRSITENFPDVAYNLYIEDGDYGIYSGSRSGGNSVRPVLIVPDPNYVSSATFAGLQIAKGPLYFNGTYKIKDYWNYDSYEYVCGKGYGSYYFSYIEMGKLFEKAGFSTSDGDIENLLDPLDGWRLPTKDEWESILTTDSEVRSGSTVNGSTNKHFALIQLTGVTHAGSSTPNGLIIFPDGLTIKGKNLSGMDNTTQTTGVTIEELNTYLNQGCVFLPASGGQNDLDEWLNGGNVGTYHSSNNDISDNYYRYGMSFQENFINTDGTDHKYAYCSVRLVHD